MRRSNRKYTTLEYVLLALVPYTKPNMELSFKPNRFFNELERISRSNRATLNSTISRAEKQGLITRKKGVPILSNRGLQRIRPLTAKTLRTDVYLMVIFDIPEQLAATRSRFRRILLRLEFVQTQKSVWTSRYDHLSYISQVVSELEIEDYVQLFECAKR